MWDPWPKKTHLVGQTPLGQLFAVQAIEETLALDIRSPLQKQRNPHPGRQGPSELLERPFFTGDLWFQELHIKQPSC